MVALWLILLSLWSIPALAGKPSCFEFEAPIHVSLPITKYSISPFKDSYESTGLLVNSISRDADLSALIAGQADIDRSYNLSFQYCEPARGVAKNGIVQVLTHGLGADKSYWDFGNKEYNYVASATAAGYATLSYDRLGAGRSEKADPYLDVQVATQVAILARLSELLQDGRLCPRIPIPKKLVHVGHSFGSLLTNSLAGSAPHLSDGVVLTGFSHNFTWGNLFQICWGFELARSHNPARFRTYSSGYLTWGSQFDNQCASYRYPYFDPDVLRQADAQKSPFAIAELLSFGSPSLAAPEFTGPVLIISGENDLSFCGGDCRGVLDAPDSLSSILFPKASPLATYIQPNMGHALNMHLNATAAYNVILDFLQDNGV